MQCLPAATFCTSVPDQHPPLAPCGATVFAVPLTKPCHRGSASDTMSWTRLDCPPGVVAGPGVDWAGLVYDEETHSMITFAGVVYQQSVPVNWVYTLDLGTVHSKT